MESTIGKDGNPIAYFPPSTSTNKLMLFLGMSEGKKNFVATLKSFMTMYNPVLIAILEPSLSGERADVVSSRKLDWMVSVERIPWASRVEVGYYGNEMWLMLRSSMHHHMLSMP